MPPVSPPYNVQYRYESPIDIQEDYYSSNPYSSPQPYSPFVTQKIPEYDTNTSALRGGTLLHKGFYDLLALIPSTPSASRFFWPAAQPAELVAGPRYETINNHPTPAPKPISVSTAPVSVNAQPKNLKARRISKDMVSKPTGFMYAYILSKPFISQLHLISY